MIRGHSEVHAVSPGTQVQNRLSGEKGSSWCNTSADLGSPGCLAPCFFRTGGSFCRNGAVLYPLLADQGLHFLNHPGWCSLGVSLQAQKEPMVAGLLSAMGPCTDHGGARLAAGSLTGEARTRVDISSRSSFGPRRTPRGASNASVGDGPQALNSFRKY